MHHYLDDDSSGSSGTCVSKTVASEHVGTFVNWLRVNHRMGVEALGQLRQRTYHSPVSAARSPSIVGRYALFEPIASGGMATVHLGKQIGEVGFSRTVAIKRLHENFVRDRQFVAMMIDEARLVSRIRHPNVVPTLDIVSLADELFVVMEYVHGASLSSLLSRVWGEQASVPAGMAAAIMLDVLHGLHAAHEAKDERGAPLEIVHRDVSPQNILVGVDGVARVLDFGIAKAAGRIQSTSTGQIKGKLAYMAPEQMCAMSMDRRVDVYAAGIVLWELLAGRHLFDGETDAQTMFNALNATAQPPSTFVSGIAPALDEVVMRALCRERDGRFPTAQEFAVALEGAVSAIPRAREVGAWVGASANVSLHQRAAQISTIEATTGPQDAETEVAKPEISNTPNETAPARAPAREQHATPASAIASPLDESAAPDSPPMPSPTVQSTEGDLSVPLRSWRGVLALSATVVGGILAVVAITLLHGRSRPEPSPPSTTSAGTASVRPNAPTPSGPQPSASGAVTSTDPAPAIPTAAVAMPPVAPPARSSGSHPRPSTSSCNPPYTVDRTGVRVPKRYCFDGSRSTK